MQHDPANEAARERPAVGEMLRRAREARGESVADVANALKLTQRQVEAMETGHFERLPGAAFVRGFVRNYGRHLGLDQEALMAGLDEATAAPKVELAPVSNAEGVMPTGIRGRPAHRPLAAVVLLLVAVIVAGWYFDWFKAPDGGELPPTAAPVAEPSGTLLAPAPQILADGTGAESAGVPAEPPAGGESATVPVPVPAVPVPESLAPPAPEAPAAPSASAEPAPGAGPEQLMFRLKGESWIEVRDATGTIVFSGIAPAGSTRTVQGKPPFAVVLGNAPQVSIEYRGQPVELGSHTRVGVARLTVQ